MKVNIFFYFWQFDLSVCVCAWYMLWPNQMNILRLLLTMICQKKMLLSPMAEIYIYDICWFNLYLFWRTKTLVIWYIDLELLWLMPTGNVLWNCLWGFFFNPHQIVTKPNEPILFILISCGRMPCSPFLDKCVIVFLFLSAIVHIVSFAQMQ